MRSGEVLSHAGLFRLMTWLSPAFPVGAFAYSSGLEWAVEAGDVTDAPSLREWLHDLLHHGSGFCDAALLAQTYRAAALRDAAGLADIAEFAAAFVPSRERQLETIAQGEAFLAISRSAWPIADLDPLLGACEARIAYPVAVGLVASLHGVELEPTLTAFLHAVVSNWISAGSRLIPLGQTDSQRVLAALEGDIADIVRRAQTATRDDLGSAVMRADLASMRHETQYTRLFRT